MPLTRLLIAVPFLAALGVSAQSHKMVTIPAGTFTAGNGYQYQVIGTQCHLHTEDTAFARLNTPFPVLGEQPQPNGLQRRVSVSSFRMATTEVSNGQYLEFLRDSLLNPQENAALDLSLKGSAKQRGGSFDYGQFEVLMQHATDAGLAPDQEAWTREWPNGALKPKAEHYFLHPAFAEYPVVGVSHSQAMAYCAWLTHKVNKALAAKGKPLQPAYRLPTEMEWEYAALGQASGSAETPASGFYPWPGTAFLPTAKGEFPANVKPFPGDFRADGYAIIAPARSFPPNAFGLHNMAGNVSEWVQDNFILDTPERDALLLPRRRDPDLIEARPSALDIDLRVVKGGSWADPPQAAMCGSRTGLDGTRGYSRVGFRLAQTITGNP